MKKRRLNLVARTRFETSAQVLEEIFCLCPILKDQEHSVPIVGFLYSSDEFYNIRFPVWEIKFTVADQTRSVYYKDGHICMNKADLDFMEVYEAEFFEDGVYYEIREGNYGYSVTYKEIGVIVEV